ncbi:MAG TPA: sulfotransferase [Casimicrobiaceae bacterium]|jgi:hypothetical protein|nr:sulfotransferase [Casimicrobiaceae bacterium]
MVSAGARWTSLPAFSIGIQVAPSTPDPASRAIERMAFICGCGHSGTTLAATMLSQHPRLYVPLYESEAFLEDGLAAQRLAKLVAEASAAGKTMIVEKTPRHIRKVDAIRRAIPGARFVVLVRDGRDVTASIAQRYPGDFAHGIARWVFDNRIALSLRGSADALIVRYEDIVVDPAREMTKVCAFLGVAYDDALLKYHERPHLWYGEKDVRRTSGVAHEHESFRNWQVNQPIFDGRGRWKRDLPQEIAAEFGRGDAAVLMTAFGYD